jgi:MFS family permease
MQTKSRESEVYATTFVSLISIWNYAGRVTAGYASEAVLARHRVPRPLLLTLVLLLACAGHLLIAFGVPRSLYAASVLVGFCFGAQWPLVFAVISEVFGLRRYSTLYNFGGMASPIGSYVLNVLVAGRLYDAEARRQGGAGAGGVCVGVDCYKRSFLVITAATVFGALVSLLLVWRTWAFYRGDIYARFREDADAHGGEALDGRLPRPVVGQRHVVPEEQDKEEVEPVVTRGVDRLQQE